MCVYIIHLSNERKIKREESVYLSCSFYPVTFHLHDVHGNLLLPHPEDLKICDYSLKYKWQILEQIIASCTYCTDDSIG